MTDNESTAAETAVRLVFEQGCAAWNRGDLDGYLASYWESDRTLWISGGALVRGKAAIAAAYKSRFATLQQMGRIAISDLEVDVLTSIDAIAFGRWTLVIDGSSSSGFFTVRLRKIGGDWLFLSDHSSAAG